MSVYDIFYFTFCVSEEEDRLLVCKTALAIALTYLSSIQMC